MVINGQIRTNKKSYAEQNHPNTCFSKEVLTPSYLVKATGVNEVNIMVPNKKGILITDEYGNASFLTVPEGEAGRNLLLFLDNNGLRWVNQPGGGTV